MTDAQAFMERCITLAAKGLGFTYTNPLVGAVLVHECRIIGEGYHRVFGGVHAEVNCIESVDESDKHLIPFSTLFVSLEPCSHFGKTPPCTDLIIKNKIPKVVVASEDPFELVAGSGIEKLRAAGVQVEIGVLAEKSDALNKRFVTFHLKQRPYVILKYARSNDGFIGAEGGEQVKISNAYTDRLVHRWRAEEHAILVGKNTVVSDDPQLNVRLWKGNDPVKVVLDSTAEIQAARMFEQGRVIILNHYKDHVEGHVQWKKVFDTRNVKAILKALFELQVQSVLVEGGAMVLKFFMESGLWDEARIITNLDMHLGRGISASPLTGAELYKSEQLLSDRIDYYFHAG